MINMSVRTTAKTESHTIRSGETLYIETQVPEGGALISGGGLCKDFPVDSAGNYVLKSSYPIYMTDGTQKWVCAWTNTYDHTHPQTVQFTVWAVYIAFDPSAL